MDTSLTPTGGPHGERTRRRPVEAALLALGIGGLVVFGVQSFMLGRMPPAAVEAAVRTNLESRPARPDEVETYGTLARSPLRSGTTSEA